MKRSQTLNSQMTKKSVLTNSRRNKGRRMPMARRWKRESLKMSSTLVIRERDPTISLTNSEERGVN
jgi:hypothetical protein